MKTLLTTHEFAAALGLTPCRVLQMIHKKRIKAHKQGRDWMIPVREADGWQKVQHKSKIWLQRVKPIAPLVPVAPVSPDPTPLA